jgi:hypothetical protein
LLAVGFFNPLSLIGVAPANVCAESKLLWDDNAATFQNQAN